MCASVTALAASAPFIFASNDTHGCFLGFSLVDFRKTLPFESYGVKEPIANDGFADNEARQLLDG